MSTEGVQHRDQDMNQDDDRDKARDKDGAADTTAGEQPDGAGPEGTIPAGGDGVAVTSSDEPSHFNPEEDEGGTEQ